MANEQHSLRDLLHEATHRIPGVPAHVEHPAGHQRRAGGGSAPKSIEPHKSHEPRSAQPPRSRSWNHSPSRPPRVLAGWQRRVGRFFGQEV